MKILVNGLTQEVHEATRVDQLLALIRCESQQVAVAVNLEFVPRSRYSNVCLKESDEVEILRPIAGG